MVSGAAALGSAAQRLEALPCALLLEEQLLLALKDCAVRMRSCSWPRARGQPVELVEPAQALRNRLSHSDRAAAACDPAPSHRGVEPREQDSVPGYAAHGIGTAGGDPTPGCRLHQSEGAE